MLDYDLAELYGVPTKRLNEAVRRNLVNQIANYALLEWPDNLKVGAAAPGLYGSALNASLSEKVRFHHALPPNWWDLPHDGFLYERRRRMAEVVRSAWKRLRGEDTEKTTTPTAAELLAAGETEGVEFKSTLRTNLHTGQSDEKMHLAVSKTLAAFMNARGGTLLVGVGDDGVPVGLAADGFPNEDKMTLHLVNLIRDRIAELFLPYIHPEFADHGDCRILSVRCERGPKPAFVKAGVCKGWIGAPVLCARRECHGGAHGAIRCRLQRSSVQVTIYCAGLLRDTAAADIYPLSACPRN